MNSVIGVSKKMTDAEFEKFCGENRDLRVERNSNLDVIIMSPVNSLSGNFGAEILWQLQSWNVAHGRKGLVFDSSAGFMLPDKSILSPDASWLTLAKWTPLSAEQKNRFAPVCPDFVIELRSKSDDLNELMEKMKAWINNGAKQAWLIDPYTETSYLFHDGIADIVTGFDKKLKAHAPLDGFELDLSMLREI
ncbi:Uma2 family endonuclease [Chryseolinea lacunae]|uniref:Uma2 family endonuclease n=1 Tax=Chryseolinea lacunae TaxID=2801331 RepID=A0ABS1L0Z2_9BACT|nr:Uma2 family endonuclease [Chryseolinea lacunae]MBL0745182.1 Uma2 family endonuclease [Chryseolinea lacunae]